MAQETNSLKEELFRIVWENDVEQISTVLKQLKDEKMSDVVKSTDINQDTPLHIAAREKRKDISLSIIRFAVQNSKRSAFLLENNFSRTCLHEAVQGGDLEILQAILQSLSADHDVTGTDQAGDTFLQMLLQSTSFSQEQVSKILSETLKCKFTKKLKNEILAKQNQRDRTCLHEAAQRGFNKVTLELIKAIQSRGLDKTILAQNSRGDTFLHVALQLTEFTDEDFDQVIATLSINPFLRLVKSKNRYGESILHLAARRRPKTYKSMVDKAAEDRGHLTLLTIQDDNGQTPLDALISKEENKVLFSILGDLSADERSQVFEDKTAEGNNFLHKIAENGKGSSLTQVLESINNKDESLELLMMKNKDGCSVLQVSAKRSTPDVFSSILEYFGDRQDKLQLINQILVYPEFPTMLHMVAQCDDSSFARVLTALHSELEKSDSGPTPLAEGSAKSGKMIKFDQNKDGFTALHLAAKEGKQDSFKALLKLVSIKEAVKILSLQTKTGKFTTLHLAAQEGHQSIVELVQAKVPVHFAKLLQIEDHNKLTPVHHADNSGYRKITDFMLSSVASSSKEDDEDDSNGHGNDGSNDSDENTQRTWYQYLLKKDNTGRTSLDWRIERDRKESTAQDLPIIADYLEHRESPVDKESSLIDLILHKAAYGNIDILNNTLKLLGTEATRLALLILMMRSVTEENVGRNVTEYTRQVCSLPAVSKWSGHLQRYLQLEWNVEDSEHRAERQSGELHSMLKQLCEILDDQPTIDNKSK